MSSIALIANNQRYAASNRNVFSQAFAATPPMTVHVPPGNIYFDGTVNTRAVASCGRIISRGPGGYSINPTSQFLNINSRFIQLGSGPLFRLSGTGFVFDGPVELVGDGVSAAIEVEGRSAPATGRHRFTNLVFRDWAQGFKCLGGYYNTEGTFVSDENHGDNCIVSGCETANTGALARFENQQAVNWVFRDCILNVINEGPQTQIGADIQRGGCVTFERLVVEHQKTTVFQVHDFSPNNRQLTCTGLYGDRLWNIPGSYLTLFKYTGDPAFGAGARWSMDADGFIGDYLQSFPTNLLIDVPVGIPTADFRYRIATSTQILTNP